MNIEYLSGGNVIQDSQGGFKRFANGETIYIVDDRIPEVSGKTNADYINGKKLRVRFSLAANYSNPTLKYADDKGMQTVQLGKDQQGRYYADITLQAYKSRIIQITAQTREITVGWASIHGGSNNQAECITNDELVWPNGAARPSYDGFVITPENTSFTFPSAPASPIEKNGKLYYFRGWKVDNSDNANKPLFEPGETVNDVYSNAKLDLPSGATSIVLYASFTQNPEADEPVEVSYNLLVRVPNDADDSQSITSNGLNGKNAAVERTTLLANGAAFEVSAGDAYTPEGNDSFLNSSGASTLLSSLSGLKTWSYVGPRANSGSTGGEAYNETVKIADFVYEHDQTITLEKDGNDPEGTTGADPSFEGNSPDNDTIAGLAGQITGPDVAATSQGFSYEDVWITSNGIYESEQAARDAYALNSAPAYTADGYVMAGWRGKASNKVFLFNIDLDDDGTDDAVKVNRDWSTMTLEPAWTEDSVVRQVHYDLNLDATVSGDAGPSETAPDGTPVSVTFGPSINAKPNFLYSLANDGTIGEMPQTIDRDNSTQANTAGTMEANRKIDFWYVNANGAAVANVEKNYISGWNTRPDGSGINVTSSMTLEQIGEAGAVDGDPANGQYKVDRINGTCAIVLYAQYGTRMLDASFTGTNAADGTVTFAPEVNGTSVVDVYLLEGTAADTVVNFDFSIKATPDVDSTINVNGEAHTLVDPRFRLREFSQNTAGATYTLGGQTLAQLNGGGNSGPGPNDAPDIALADGKAAMTATLAGNANRQPGTYTDEVAITIDAGGEQLGWNYKRTATLQVNFHVLEAWNFAAVDIDYANETLVFAGEGIDCISSVTND